MCIVAGIITHVILVAMKSKSSPQSDMPFENKVLILLENIDRKIELSGERMDMFEEKFERLEKRVERIDTNVSYIKATMTPLEEFEPLEKRVSYLEKVVL